MCGRSSFRDAMTAPALRGQKLYSRTRLSGVYSVWTVAYVGRCAGWLADSEQCGRPILASAASEEKAFDALRAASTLASLDG
jgi:hypothetical protein